MSMFDALRRMGSEFFERGEEDATPSKIADPVEEYALLVQCSRIGGQIDTHSGTWAAVSAWAATELLKTRAKYGVRGITESMHVALSERERVLKEILSLDRREARKPRVVKDAAPHIP